MAGKLKIQKFPYEMNQGMYGTLYSPESKKNPFYEVDWDTCRELFHDTFNGRKRRFVFSCKPENQAKLKDFIRRADNILKLKREFRCKFFRTSQDDVIGVTPGPFWGRRKHTELLTILLRAARHYEQTPTTSNKNFWFACEKEDYLKKTWAAFLRFMGGHTEIKTTHFSGWVANFTELEEFKLKTYFRKCTADKKK